MNAPKSELALHSSRTARGFFAAAGILFLGLGFLGVFLPLLPTTVFVLLAAACFSRSSPRFYGWLLNHRTFGPPIRAWRSHRCIPARAKRVAIIAIVLSFAVTVIWVAATWYSKLALAALGVLIAAYILRIPVLESRS